MFNNQMFNTECDVLAANEEILHTFKIGDNIKVLRTSDARVEFCVLLGYRYDVYGYIELRVNYIYSELTHRLDVQNSTQYISPRDAEYLVTNHSSTPF
jgi:hypothetical protein